MIWFALGLALVVGGIVGVHTRSTTRALRVGAITFVVGVVVSLLIVLSGVLGG